VARRPMRSFRVILPLATPGVLTTALLTFIFCWNKYLFALVLCGDRDLKTLAAFAGDFVKVQKFTTAAFAPTARRGMFGFRVVSDDEPASTEQDRSDQERRKPGRRERIVREFWEG
jgi:hypothetical protein